ncbi:MAG: SUMF1/EgtB/PvdO family nonheme iron enzyme [Deltaproteobacteria bacterium]|jgi:formylglycine-generating enzyme required for sulfatase activity|nr:SUMF1/EgtB/PvdO family nonheme iron enzyme [Deltaproteobacteria bacterium]
MFILKLKIFAVVLAFLAAPLVLGSGDARAQDVAEEMKQALELRRDLDNILSERKAAQEAPQKPAQNATQPATQNAPQKADDTKTKVIPRINPEAIPKSVSGNQAQAPAPAQNGEPPQNGAAKVFNPRPDETDIVVPMPCGLSMVFKLVAVPAAGYLGDVELRQGVLAENEKGFVERQFLTPLASSLKLENLAGELGAKAKGLLGEKADYQLYFIGKYEVSVGQWRSVMEGCEALGPGAELPMAGISRVESLEFLKAYNEWLLKNGPQFLPAFKDKYVGFLRLPTEAEWEYAARGGQMVTLEEMEKEKLFPNPGKLSLSEFGFFSAEGGEETGPKPIGTLAPNPLGLYDIPGNVSELCNDSYKVSTGDRLQGTEGGNLLKGGSYLSSGGEVLPGSRVETPKYTAQGETKLPYMGIRIVMSSPNTADQRRNEELKVDFKNLASVDQATQNAVGKAATAVTGAQPQAPATLEPAALMALEPVERINRLMPFVESAGQKVALSSLLRDFANYNELKAIETKDQAKTLFDSVLFAAYGIRDTSLRRNQVISNLIRERAFLDYYMDNLKSTKNAQKKAEIQDLINQSNQVIATLTPEVAEFNAALENQFAYYKTSLQFLTQYEPKLLATIVNQTKGEYQGTDSYSVSMNNSLEVTIRDITSFLNSQGASVVIDKVALPAPTPAQK